MSVQTCPMINLSNSGQNNGGDRDPSHIVKISVRDIN